MNARMQSALIVCGVLAAMIPAALPAMGGGDVSAFDSKPANPDYAKAVAAIKAKKWDEAIALLNRAAAAEPQNADVYNYLGYAERQRGNMDAAFKQYDKALALNPKHRGAREYLGEAYLMTGNLAKAEEQLAALDKLCFFSCSEYRELKEKVAEYKEKHQARSAN
jgi:tetratricopeptide (TPR) repeat protein